MVVEASIVIGLMIPLFVVALIALTPNGFALFSLAVPFAIATVVMYRDKRRRKDDNGSQ
jgi:hypothetical protein